MTLEHRGRERGRCERPGRDGDNVEEFLGAARPIAQHGAVLGAHGATSAARWSVTECQGARLVQE